MRKSLTLKTLLRSPAKTLLTFLLIASASFALFSRMTDYAVTSRETADAKSFYHGVAALDITVQDMEMEWFDKEGYLNIVNQEIEDKPWPAKEQLDEFASLPGVTLEDTRYMTAGLVDNCKRVYEESFVGHGIGSYLLEGTYEGYDDSMFGGLMFDDVALIASSYDFPLGESAVINYSIDEEFIGSEKNPYPKEFWEQLKGSRILVSGSYVIDEERMTAFYDEERLEPFRIIDGLGENYLDTEEFARYKELKEALDNDIYTYDIVYTSDTRSIPSFNERKMVVTKGRPLAEGDTAGCVVSELFLETYGLSIGDMVSVRLGDKLFAQDPLYGTVSKGRLERASDFTSDTVELEIVGAYRINDTLGMRILESDWSYSPSTVFVPKSLLPVEIPDDYEQSAGEYSVFIEDARGIEAFKEAAEPLAARMGVSLRFSDGGWLNVKDNFETGTLISLLTTVLYVIGALLALLLASYLYIGRNKESYAIMRAMGVPDNTAGNSLVLPFIVLSAIAVPIGGAAGLIYTSKTAAGAIAALADSAMEGYVPDDALPIGIIILCLLFELAFTAVVTLFFLKKMKKISPLGLLQGGALRVGMDTKSVPDMTGYMAVPKGLDFSKISVAGEMPQNRKYGALCHVTAFTLRHMRRSIGKTAVSLILTAVLVTGIGTFALAKRAYGDAFYKVDVNTKVLDFASSAIVDLSKSRLAGDFYCHSTFSVRTNGNELNTPMVFTDNMERYMADGHINYTVTYADGYDMSALDGDTPVCLVGEGLAEMLGISAGDEIALLSDSKYSALKAVYEEEGEEELQESAEEANVMYRVIGTVASADGAVNDSIYAGIHGPMEELYGQKFSFGYCEFTLADNEKVDELDRRLANLKNTNSKYARSASYYIDTEALNDVIRIRTLLELLFPIAVAAEVFIGMAGYLLVILQSAREAVFLRILGITKKRARCMMALEQLLLCMTGIVLVACGLALYSPGLFARSTETLAFCYALYFLGCLCGSATAAVHVTRGRILELLQVKA